jgi:hypothetical protein
MEGIMQEIKDPQGTLLSLMERLELVEKTTARLTARLDETNTKEQLEKQSREKHAELIGMLNRRSWHAAMNDPTPMNNLWNNREAEGKVEEIKELGVQITLNEEAQKAAIMEGVKQGLPDLVAVHTPWAKKHLEPIAIVVWLLWGLLAIAAQLVSWTRGV